MKDPNLIWPFTGISAVGGFFAFVFLFCYWNLDKTMAKEDAERETARRSIPSTLINYLIFYY